jgi:conjugative transposon TraK protein
MKLSFGIAVMGLVAGISMAIFSMIYFNKKYEQSLSEVYVIKDNIPFVGTRGDAKENRPAEIKAVIEDFHNLFFSLPPDEKYIESQLKKAMYLVDATGIQQYNTLKEKSYFNMIVSTSSIITTVTDSIEVDYNEKKWTYYGTQKIERPSSITVRNLITTGKYQDVPRSDNNPHGVLLTRWKTIENKDLSYNEKHNY